MIANGLNIVSLHVLRMGVELTPELGFNNEVQDISKWWTRHTKIIYPSVGFVQSQFVPKIPKRTDLLLNRSCTTVSAKTEGIFAPKLVETSHFSNLLVKIILG